MALVWVDESNLEQVPGVIKCGGNVRLTLQGDGVYILGLATTTAAATTTEEPPPPTTTVGATTTEAATTTVEEVLLFRPSGDDACAFDNPVPSANHWENVDDPVEQPADPGTDDYNRDTGVNIDDFSCTDVSYDGNSTSIDIWVNGDDAIGGGAADLYIAGGWRGSVALNHGAGQAWDSANFAGAWTAAQVNACKIRINHTGGPAYINYCCYGKVNT